MTADPKAIVAAGYDLITENYLRLVRSSGSRARDKYLAIIRDRLQPGARIIELGCGAGVPMTRALAADYDVVGLDISSGQLALAQVNVPRASLVRGDMARLPFAYASADAVAAFYSSTHVPRAEHRQMLGEIRRVLRPRALLVLTMGSSDNPDGFDDNWLGASMFFSHFDGDTNVVLVESSRFEIVEAEEELEDEFGLPTRWRWVVARCPA